ncbi:hypothetical protein [Cerasicoccus maritimus]|uniref:hypothetical protein n=1 Tax=Cerasicoccus maritimus TaxID=490089 RepID=UPI002852886E|nr:hypothetical protein [Cerasicoccus maritimus]
MHSPTDITEQLSRRELPRNATTVERQLRTDFFGGFVLTCLLAGLLGQLAFLLAMG